MTSTFTLTTASTAPTAPAVPDTATPVGASDAWVHAAFRALGTGVRVTVLAASESEADGMVDLAGPLLEHVESRWSRFRPGSELSRLNAAGGASVMLSDDTFDAVAHALEAWRATDGRFDPTVLPSLIALGYDRDFRSLATDGPPPRVVAPRGCADIVTDPLVRSVTLPVDVSLDLGGIGKGLAADRLAASLMGAGAVGVCVDLGGDVHVAGVGPHDAPWPIVIQDPFGTGATGSLAICDGAVATSSRLLRSWRRGSRRVHHIVDPRTGDCAETGLTSVTVVAGSTCWAEVFAKAAFVAGPAVGAALLADAGLSGLFVHDDGRVTELPGLAAFRP